MKHYAPPARPSAPPPPRIPRFHPVPVGTRRDGWTVARQAHFIGFLAQTRSVAAAARAVSMGRESAYRLRKRRGAAGFAAAWDAALGKPRPPVDLASDKATGLDVGYRYRVGLVRTEMRAGRYIRSHREPDETAHLRYLALLDRASARMGEEG